MSRKITQLVRVFSGGTARAQLWKRAWFACGLIALVALVGHVHTSRMVPQSNDDVLVMGYEQRVTTQEMVKGALMLEAAIKNGEYKSIAPRLEFLRERSSQWESTHERLSAMGPGGLEEPIARLINPHTQIQRGLDELLLVGKSAQRRQPYLDEGTVDRISRASRAVWTNEGSYSEGLIRITASREQMIDARISQFRSSSRQGLVVLIALVVLCTPAVVFPVISAIGHRGHGREESQDIEQGSAGNRRAA